MILNCRADKGSKARDRDRGDYNALLDYEKVCVCVYVRVCVLIVCVFISMCVCVCVCMDYVTIWLEILLRLLRSTEPLYSLQHSDIPYCLLRHAYL